MRTCSLLAAVSAFFILPLASCLGDAGASTSASATGGVAQATVGSGSAASQNPLGGHGSTGAGGFNQQSIPTLSYPEERWIRLEREIWYLDLDGVQRGLRDQLLSDGNGNVRLDLLEVWDPVGLSWGPPSAEQAETYTRGSVWNVTHRDLHLGRAVALQSNYAWSLIGGMSVAGRNTTGTLAANRYGLGDVALYHDDNDGGLLLAWSVTDPATSQVMVSLTTTLIELQPDLNGVGWPQPSVQRVPYDARQHLPLLGISLVPPGYLPPGSYLEASWFSSLTQPSAPSPSAKLDAYSDGLRTLVVIQYRDDSLAGTNVIPPIPVGMRLADDWEILVRGNQDVRVFSVQGSFPALDLQLVSAGLVE